MCWPLNETSENILPAVGNNHERVEDGWRNNPQIATTNAQNVAATAEMRTQASPMADWSANGTASAFFLLPAWLAWLPPAQVKSPGRQEAFTWPLGAALSLSLFLHSPAQGYLFALVISCPIALKRQSIQRCFSCIFCGHFPEFLWRKWESAFQQLDNGKTCRN